MSTRLDLPIIPPAVLSGIVEIGQRERCDVASWFADTGLSAAQVFTDNSTMVSFHQAAEVLRRAVRAMPGRPLGMQVGGRDMLLSMGMLGLAMRSCATLGEAMSVGTELHQVSGSLMDLELEQFDDHVALRLNERSPEPELISFLCEEVLCSTTVLARSVIGSGWSPTRVELTYAPPPYARQYVSFLHCPVEFLAAANRMVLPAAALELPLPTHDKPTQAIAIDACRRLLDLGRTGPTITVTVETLLEQNLRQPLTMSDIADRLHVTERTLRRQLADTGESFSTIKDRVRERRATYLLRESGLPVTAVAWEVGYSDTREFRRAYIRWTGQPPSAARALRARPR
ncbi:AraC family transcriptional regulator [Nocardia nova]|uniref:AraC family transcriptional regulator n=1 Tax=Nocardia nova TaxID=37330 RepID=UPI0011DC724C|nr:AraC family transcriptional regulator [Nocardia nova]